MSFISKNDSIPATVEAPIDVVVAVTDSLSNLVLGDGRLLGSLEHASGKVVFERRTQSFAIDL